MKDDLPARIVIDANAVIDFIKLGALPQITTLEGSSFLVVEEVVAEVQRPDQTFVLKATIAKGRIDEVRVETADCLELFSRLQRMLDKGEAASLAYAARYACAFLSDEKDARFIREVAALVGQENLIRSEELLVRAIKKGCLSFRSLENRVRKLDQTARSRRDRDDVNHLKRVVERVSLLLKGRTKS